MREGASENSATRRGERRGGEGHAAPSLWLRKYPLLLVAREIKIRPSRARAPARRPDSRDLRRGYPSCGHPRFHVRAAGRYMIVCASEIALVDCLLIGNTSEGYSRSRGQGPGVSQAL